MRAIIRPRLNRTKSNPVPNTCRGTRLFGQGRVIRVLSVVLVARFLELGITREPGKIGTTNHLPVPKRNLPLSRFRVRGISVGFGGVFAVAGRVGGWATCDEEFDFNPVASETLQAART